jgi:hypothetical protein
MQLTPHERGLLESANKLIAERARTFLEGYLTRHPNEPDTALVDLIVDFRFLQGLNPDLRDLAESSPKKSFITWLNRPRRMTSRSIGLDPRS